MKDESDPILPDEFILRRIPNLPDYINLALPMPVARGAFGPSSEDSDGLSIYREKFVSAQEVAEAGNNAAGYYVVRLRAQDILNLGLNLLSDPKAGQLPGHTLIPELSIGAKKADRKKYKELTLNLAKLSSSNNIVYSPD